MDDILYDLNESQKEAVTSTEGYIRVIAGAGSGKTRALSHRFAYLVNAIGILPSNILCVTFTNKSANEMRQRIHQLTGDNDTGYINTFHGFCLSILQEDSHAVQYPKSFMVLDTSDINEMLKLIYDERGLTLRDMTFQKARDMIEMKKLKDQPKYYLDMITMSLDTLHEKYLSAVEPQDIIFYGYLYQEKKCFALDYNDLIKFTLYIFSENPDIRLKWQQRMEYIMIDEFQDIDALQYRLMQVLCSYHKNLFVVGDPDQTIYSWRGANVSYLMEFDKNFPGTHTIMMMQNYRSTPEILAVANSLITKNRYRIKKDLLPALSSGQTPICHHAKNAQAEALWIAQEIQGLCKKEREFREITILYRAHYVTRSLEEVFLKENIPYALYSGTRFFDRMEIKDALSYLRMIVYKDDLSFRRIRNVPKRNLGVRRMKFLEEYAASHTCTLYDSLLMNLETELFRNTAASSFVQLIEGFAKGYEGQAISDIFSAILDESGYEMMLRTEGCQERLDNLAELKQSIYEYEISCGEEAALPDYLRHIALFANTDVEDQGNKVKLMTVHAAKGLEFPCVFLCGMNEGVFPTRKTNSPQAMEEERRLAFVAVTRAKEQLYLSSAEGRNFDASPRYPSRFLLDIEPSLLSFTKEPDKNLLQMTRRYVASQEELYRDSSDHLPVGQKILHPIFGNGEILSIDEEKRAYLIHFDQFVTPRNIAFRVKLKTL